MIFDKLEKADNYKYYIFLVFIAVNAILFSTGEHFTSFLSVALVCALLVHFGNKTDQLLTRTFRHNSDLLAELEKYGKALNKMTHEEQAKFKRILKSL